MKKLRPKFFKYQIKKLKLNLKYKLTKIDFRGYYSANNLGIAESGATGYEPCYNIVKYLKKCKPTANDSFLDLGSGKGCAQYYARKFAFSKIDGVELSKQLYDVSVQNAKIIGDQRIHMFNEDFVKFDKYNDYNFFFLYNPCFENAMQAVAKKIRASFDATKKRTVVIYNTAKFKDLFLNLGFKVLYNHKNDYILELKW